MIPHSQFAYASGSPPRGVFSWLTRTLYTGVTLTFRLIEVA
jgi:hypothetical protein